MTCLLHDCHERNGKLRQKKNITKFEVLRMLPNPCPNPGKRNGGRRGPPSLLVHHSQQPELSTSQHALHKIGLQDIANEPRAIISSCGVRKKNIIHSSSSSIHVSSTSSRIMHIKLKKVLNSPKPDPFRTSLLKHLSRKNCWANAVTQPPPTSLQRHIFMGN